MEITLKEIGKIVNGLVIGNPSHKINNVATFKQAKIKKITFADNPKFLKQIKSSNAGAVIVSKKYDFTKINLIVVKNPKLAFSKLIEFFNPEEKNTLEISKLSFINKTAMLSQNIHIDNFVNICKNVRIGEKTIINGGSFIGDNVIIGENTTIKPNVTIMKNCIIGNNVLIHSGTVIGSDGFGFITTDSSHKKMPHIGIVQIDDNVEIGACNTIDRGTIGKTWIKNGVKTDNLVHIAHNVTIGKNSLIISNVAIAGSTSIGNNVIIAGKSGISGHLEIGDNVIIGAKSGVTKNIKKNEIVSGFPATTHKKWLKIQRIISTLPNLIKKIKELSKKIENNLKDNIKN